MPLMPPGSSPLGPEHRRHHAREQVEDGEERAPPDVLERRAGEPEKEQVAEQVQQAGVDEHVGEEVAGVVVVGDQPPALLGDLLLGLEPGVHQVVELFLLALDLLVGRRLLGARHLGDHLRVHRSVLLELGVELEVGMCPPVLEDLLELLDRLFLGRVPAERAVGMDREAGGGQ